MLPVKTPWENHCLFVLLIAAQWSYAIMYAMCDAEWYCVTVRIIAHYSIPLADYNKINMGFTAKLCIDSTSESEAERKMVFAHWPFVDSNYIDFWKRMFGRVFSW